VGTPTCEFTLSQSTDVPTGEGFGTSQKLDCTTADATPASSSQFKIETKILKDKIYNI
jgi:pantoate kinase